jgi:septal ring factor EnvC (AmiA/AmiB activator)
LSALRRARGAAALAALLVAPFVAPAAEEAQRLEAIRSEIQEREARAREYASEAEGALEELDGIDRELSEIRHSMTRLRQRGREAEEELVKARESLAEASGALEATRGDLEARLVSLYKFTAVGGAATLYSADDFQAFVRRREGLARILDEDRRLFARHRAAEQIWQREREQSQALVDEIATARREVVRRERLSSEMLVERRNLVALLNARSDRELRQAKELRAAAERLERALEQMSRGPQPSPGGGLRKGALPWPVQGPVRLSFGRQTDPEFGTETLRTGVEIAAPSGALVRAVADGRVLFAGWFRGFGQMVIVDHGARSVSVSAYLEELKAAAGDEVRSGQEIGSVGQTGSISDPGLYFEIRQNGKPVDPQAWLAEQ